MAKKPPTKQLAAASKATKPARKASTGTSYTATGITDPLLQQPQLDDEQGSSLPVIIRETVPELLSAFTRSITYAKMMNDAGVDVSMRAMKTPALGAEYFMEPYDDLPLNLEISEFVGANLFEGMSAPMVNSLEDILHFFEDGYSVLEKVVELREWTPKGQNRNTRQYTMLKKLGVRPSTTVKQIVYDDNGGPLQIIQNAIRADGKPEEVTIDISKALIFTFSRKGGDLQGKSLLRTAYMHWYYKNHMYKIDAIQKERNSLGVPVGRLLPGYNTKDKELMRTMLRNLRSNEEGFALLTPNVELEFLEIHGQLVNVLESATHHNAMILLNVMAAFLSVTEQGSSGSSRASGGVQSDIFMKALRYIANYIADVFNMYLIPELVVWNYPTKNFPKLRVRNIGETRDLQMLGSALAGMIAQGGLTMDLETENHFRKIFDLPAKLSTNVDTATYQKAGTPVQPFGTPSPANGANPTNGNTPTNGKTGTGGGSPATPAPPQKGNVKPGGGGNSGKPVGAPQ